MLFTVIPEAPKYIITYLSNKNITDNLNDYKSVKDTFPYDKNIE